MKQRKHIGLFLAIAVSSWAQSPTPQEIGAAQKKMQAGQLQLTPEAIEAAKAQYPDLKNYSDQDIQKKAAEQQAGKTEQPPGKTEQPADKTEGAPSAAPDGKAGEEQQWVSKNPGGGAGGGGGGGGQRFPAGLPRFGADFFRNADVGDGLGANAPALPDYLLSPGDEIQVYTWGRESRNAIVTIDNEGMFSYPPLEPVRVAGLRFAAAQKLLTAEFEKIQGVTASIGLGRLKSIRVMVLGEAVSPGSYVLPAGITVTAALFRSGGVSGIGSLRNIEVRRANRVVASLDLYDMLLKGESRGDIQLLPGDVVFVPVAKVQVAVYGMVKRPAIYEVKPGFKALETVDLAGGLLSDAFKGRIRLDRVQNNKRNVVLDVDMEKLDARSNVRLEDGDILFVDRVLDRTEDVVYLRGNVNRPGRYQYKKGMTVRDLVPSLKDLKQETFFEYAHILRPAPDDERPTLLNFSLADVFSKGVKVALQPRDTVVIYNRYDVVSRPVVKVSGMIRQPGDYPFRESMRISDLVILAGGLGDAYLPEAHVLRVSSGPGSDSQYTELIRVNLKNALENPAGPDNIELKPFDSFIVFARSSFIYPKSVSIYGAVNHEGSFGLAENMGIPDLITLAGGLTKNSYKLSIEVARRNVVNDSILTRQVLKMSLKELLDGKVAFKLQDGDGVYVREVINSREFSSVTLDGEFNFPGRYEFSPGERLSSVIRRAGGFSPQAYLRGAVFLRESVKRQQLSHAQEVGRRLEGQLQGRLQQTTDDKDRASIQTALSRGKELVSEISDAPYLGRVVVKLDKNMKFAGTDWDITLENGDNLTVGPHVSTVSVLGEVYSPTTVIFTRKTNSVGECLGQAGGVNGYGDYGETFYVAPDGSISTPHNTPWYSSFRCKSVEAGGTIIVPLKPPAKDYLDAWVKLTQILYQTAIAVGVAKTLF